MNDDYVLGEPIMAPATPQGSSALCVLRLSGQDICSKVSLFFSRAQALKQSHTMAYGLFLSPTGQVVDEVMMCCFYAPRSYTGEDMIEIYPHGNMHVVQQILSVLGHFGFRMALPGEFTYRATMLGKIDLIKAEAIHELIMSKSNACAQNALQRLTGQLSTLLNPIYEQIVRIASYIRMHLDYPEDEVEPLPVFDLASCQMQLHNLLEQSKHLKRWQQGVTVVIVGPPNVGKSSLFNLLLQQDRALVSSQAGTTRDYLEAEIQLCGYPVRLVDTAGLHESTDAIESLGIRKSLALLNEADLILFVTTAQQQSFLPELEPYKEKVLRVFNKTDVAPGPPEELSISVLCHTGIETLIKNMLMRLDFTAVGQQNQTLMLGSVRQQQLCEQALKAIIDFTLGQTAHDLDAMAFHIQVACTALSKLLGKNPSQQIDTAMFSHFCLGK